MKIHVIDYDFTNSVSITDTVDEEMKLMYIRCSEVNLKLDITVNGKKLSNRPVISDLIELPQNEIPFATIPKNSTININIYASDAIRHKGQIALMGI